MQLYHGSKCGCCGDHKKLLELLHHVLVHNVEKPAGLRKRYWQQHVALKIAVTWPTRHLINYKNKRKMIKYYTIDDYSVIEEETNSQAGMW